jgi:D-threo-aldose 1-dehydrogenase
MDDVAILPTRRVGRCRFDLSVLGLGGAPLGDLYVQLDDATAISAVEAAGQGGINLFDTAPLYGYGLSEHRIGTGLRRLGRAAFVSTKVGRVLSPARRVMHRDGYAGGLNFTARFDYSRDGALRAIEQSLLRLGRERIDIALIHDVDGRTHGSDLDRRFGEAMDGAYRALADLRAEGVVGAIGVGVNESAVCARFARTGDFDCMMLAGRYTLLEQGALDDLLPEALRRGIAVLLAGIFNSGILAVGPGPGAKYDYGDAAPEIIARTRRIEAICREHRTALPHAALQFGLAHPAVASVVVGAVSPAEVARNLGFAGAPVSEALWADLKTAGLIRPDAPTTNQWERKAP